MRVVKSILRLFLALQAVILILTPVAGIIGSLRNHASAPSSRVAHHTSGIAAYGVMLALLALGAVFANAWWSTRKPSATLNLWALGASLIYLVEGIACFVFIHRYGYSGTSGLDLVAIGAGGLFVFSRRETLPNPAAAPARRAPVAGDRTNPLTRQAVTVLSTVAQIAALILWTHWAFSNHLPGAHGLTWIALVTLASVLSTVIHECGHAVMAWCFEMGLLSFKAGPFQFRRREGKWAFKFYPAGILTPCGAVGAVPTTLDPPRWEELVVIAAGPAANLLFGLAAIWAVLHDRWAAYQHSWEFIAFAGSFCVIAAILNLFPFMSEDGAYSDGARILQIVTHSPLDDYHRAMASIAATGLTARRYRDLDIAQIERAAILFPHDFRGLHLLLCACHYYEDCGRFSDASASLAAAESIYSNNFIDLPGPLHTVFIIGHAYLNHDAATARLWADRMELKKTKRGVDYWLAQTALCWIEGNRHGAEDSWQEANLEAHSLPRFGAYEFDRYRCALLREAINSPIMPPAVSPAATVLVAPGALPLPTSPPPADAATAWEPSFLAATSAVSAASASSTQTCETPRHATNPMVAPGRPTPIVFNLPKPVAPADVAPLVVSSPGAAPPGSPDLPAPVPPVLSVAAIPVPAANASLAKPPVTDSAAARSFSRSAKATVPQEDIDAAVARLIPARPAVPPRADIVVQAAPVTFRIPDIAVPAKPPVTPIPADVLAATPAPPFSVDLTIQAASSAFHLPQPAPLHLATIADGRLPPASSADTVPPTAPPPALIADARVPAPLPAFCIPGSEPFAFPNVTSVPDSSVPNSLLEFHLPEPSVPAASPASNPLAAFFRRPTPAEQPAPPIDEPVPSVEPAPSVDPAPQSASDPLAFFRRTTPPVEPAPAVDGPPTSFDPATQSASDPLAFFRRTTPPVEPAPAVDGPPTSFDRAPQSASDPLAFFRRTPPVEPAPAVDGPPTSFDRAPQSASDPLAFFRRTPPVEPAPAVDEPDPVDEPALTEACARATPPTAPSLEPLAVAAQAPEIAAQATPPSPPEPIAVAPVVIAAVIAEPAVAAPTWYPNSTPAPPPASAAAPPSEPETRIEQVAVVVTRGTGTYTRIPASGVLRPKPPVSDRPKVDPMDLIRSEMIESLRTTAD